jgi:predicted DCC family thiol-disulfide oxidoreductase YuxK
MTRTLLYDGTCGLCATSVQFILQREKSDTSLLFAPLQGETAARILQAHPELASVDSVILVEQDGNAAPRISVRSDAVIKVMRYLGGAWSMLGGIASIVPRFLRDASYNLVARTRYKVFGRDTACLLPTPEQRVRFLP